MYRSRLGGELAGVAAGFVSSAGGDREIAAYDILGSQAHVVMLYDRGLVSKEDAAKILGALDKIGRRRAEDLVPGAGGAADAAPGAGGAADAAPGAGGAGDAAPGAGGAGDAAPGAGGAGDAAQGAGGAEDIHEMIESLVAAEAGTGAGGRMHTARSRNDQVAADMRMKVRDDAMDIMDLIVDAARALVELASRHTKTAVPLYTHLQQAQVGTFSHYLMAYADALMRDHERFAGAFNRANLSPLGAGPVGGTRLPIDREMTAGLLGFDGLVENSVDATSSRDFAAEFASASVLMMAGASRLAEDFVLWSSTEFGFVELADRFASPSSVMPQKKNPDVLELVRGKAAASIGSLSAILIASKGLPTGYGRDLQEIKPHLWAISNAAAGTLAILAGMISTVSVNKAAMKRAAGRTGGYLTALDVAERITAGGVAFREAHGITGRLVQAAHSKGVPLARLAPSDVKAAVEGTRAVAGSVTRIIRSCTVDESLRSRSSRGSAGFAEQDRMVADRSERLRDLAAANAERRKAVGDAVESLRVRIAHICDGRAGGGRGRQGGRRRP